MNPSSPLPDLNRLCIHTITTKPWAIETSAAKFAAAGVKGITVWRDTLTGRDIAKHRRLFAAYSIVYPFVWTVSRLDALLPASSGYMLIASALRHE